MGKKKTPHHKRRMIGFTTKQWDWLEKERERLGLPSISELVRRIVDKEREKMTSEEV